MLQYVVDEVNSDRIAGWAFDPDAVPEITVMVDDEAVGVVRPGAYRVDVAQAIGDERAIHSGFEFRFDPDHFAHALSGRARVTVRVADRDAAQIEVPVLVERALMPSRGPFPPEVLALLSRYDAKYATTEPWDDALADAAVRDLCFLVERGPRTTPELHRYLALVAQLWIRAAFVERHFPRENEHAAVEDKDRSAVQSSGVELFAIAAHLVTLRAHGIDGSFAEFGCFKGFSTAILSDACHQLDVPMHVFDSFQGLPPSDSEYYHAGDFAGSRPDVERNVAGYGRAQPVQYHEGFFSETLGSFSETELMSMWMDVDLEASAIDVLTVLPRLDPRGVLFSHECPPELFEAELRAVRRSPDQVVPPIVDAFATAGRPLAARHVSGNTGAFWDAERGIAPLPTSALLVLRDLAISVVQSQAPAASRAQHAPAPERGRVWSRRARHA